MTALPKLVQKMMRTRGCRAGGAVPPVALSHCNYTTKTHTCKISLTVYLTTTKGERDKSEVQDLIEAISGLTEVMVKLTGILGKDEDDIEEAKKRLTAALKGK